MNERNHLLFKIDTADIFNSIVERWPAVNKDFVKNKLEDHLIDTLRRKHIFLPFSHDDRQAYIEKVANRLYNENNTIAVSSDAFPFADCFIITNKGQDEILSYTESCELTATDPEFLVFFALKISVIDILNLQRFLIYHYLGSFEKNRSKFMRFLESILKKYDVLLTSKQIAEIESAIGYLGVRKAALNSVILAEISVIEELKEQEELEDQEKEATLHTKVLAAYYMLHELGCNRSTADVSDMARFIVFLTGKQSKAKIGGTNIYKMINDPFRSTAKSDKQVLANLQKVREHFEKLNLHQLVKLISKDIEIRADL